MNERVDGVWRRARGFAVVAVLGGVSAVALGGCIWMGEGCTYPPELGSSAVIPLELDAGHPAAASSIEVILTADALPSDVTDRGARLQLTLDRASDVALTFVPADTGAPTPLIVSQGKVSLPLDHCRADEPCTVQGLVIVEWKHPRPDAVLETQLTVDGLARVPNTTKQCGFKGGNPVTVTATPPAPWGLATSAALGEASRDGTELTRHVTVRLGNDEETPSTDERAIASGHIALTPDPEPPELGPSGTLVPGLWLRVTPDDGGPAVLDGPVPISYPSLPADATFPIDASCARPCERGYWVQAAAYDPVGRSVVDPATSVYGWALAASVASASTTGGSTGSVELTFEETTAFPAPPSLIQRGTGAPFRVDGSHPVTTLAIAVAAPARPARPFGDSIAHVPVSFVVTTVPVEGAEWGQLWLSNGHYIGDGSTGDDAADTGATGGPSTRSTPAGRPFAACAPTTDACSAKTGLVLHRYDGVFDKGAETPPYDVRWEWAVVGAPPGATVTVEPLEGETLDVARQNLISLVMVGALVVGGVLAILLLLRATRRRRSPTPGL